METYQVAILAGLFLFNWYLFFKSKSECNKGNSFGVTYNLTFLGIFVWGDALILSLFWMFVSGSTLILQDWVLFLLVVSLFWLIRSVGETLYWFLQQFATVKRDKPENLIGYRFVKNESIWFMYQVMWQCITVITLVTSIYLVSTWVHAISA